MPAKHSARVFVTARLVLSVAAAVLVLLVGWIAVRAVGPAEASRQPSVVLPSMPKVPLGQPGPVTPAPSRSAPVSPSAARSSAAARTSRPVPSSARPSSRPPSSSPAAREDVAATLSVGANWEQGYVAAVRITNDGDRPVRWRVTVSHTGDGELRLRNVWNADGDQSGTDLVFQGGSLEPGATLSFGYQTAKRGRGDIRPAGCNAVGGTCTMR